MSHEKRKEDLRQEDIEGLKAFEAALSSLVPRADRLNRDRLMFFAGQQSRVGFAHQEPATDAAYQEKNVGFAYQESGTKDCNDPARSNRGSWWAKPTLRAVAWPAAFSAMTTLTVVLAVLLSIRPTTPAGSSNHPSMVANAKENKKQSAAIPPVQNVPAQTIASENDFNQQIPPASPLFAFLQLFGIATPASISIEPSLSVSNATPSYPELRDRILRHGLDSLQIAQTAPRVVPHHLSEPSTNRELLKELLPDLP